MIALPMMTVLCLLALTGAARAAETQWHRDIDEALTQAAKEKKLVVMDIYADWCGPCRMMDQQTFADEKVQKRLGDFVMIKVDADVNTKLAAKYGTGSLPTIVAIMSDGSPVLTTPGFHPPAAFIAWLDEAEGKVDALHALEEAWDADPDDIETAVALSRQYLMMNRAEDGLPILRRVEAKALANPDIEARARFQYLLGLTLLTNDDFDAGVEVLEQFGGAFPDDQRGDTARRLLAEGRFLGANAQLEADEYEEARTRFAAVVENDAFPDIVSEAERRLEMLELLGKPAPDLTVGAWIAGDATPLDALKGKVVLIDFFQIICPGCQRAKPRIEALREEYGGDGLEVLGVAVAFEQESVQQPDAIRAYVEKTGYDWPVALDKNLSESFKAFRAMGSPWTVLVDRQGTVRHASFFDEEEVTRRVAQLLKEAA